MMGEGKTTVVIPLLCAMLNDNNFLNIVVMPHNLIASIAEDEMAKTLSTCFKKSIDVLLFSDAHKMNVGQLKVLLERIEKAHVEHRTILTTSSSLLALSLVLPNHFENNDNNDEKVRIIKNIAAIFKQHGRAIIDEADLAFDVTHAQQIASGRKLRLDTNLTAIVSCFYEVLAGDKDITSTFTLPFLSNSGVHALTDVSYPQLKAMLVDKLLIVTRGQSFLRSDKILDDAYCNYLAQFGTAKLARYWHEPNDAHRQDLFSDPHDDDLKDIFAVIAEELNGTLLATVDKKVYIHYGPLPEPMEPDASNAAAMADYTLQKAAYEQEKYIAVPYQNGRPLHDMRTADAIESCNLTIQKDLNLKNFTPYVAEEIAAMKNLAQTSASFSVRYEMLMGDDAPTIFDVDVDDIYKAATRIARPENLSMQIDLIKKHALSQIPQYEKQLHTNSFIYEYFFNTVHTLGGSLYNHQSFADAFILPAHLSDTTESALFTLSSMNVDVRTVAMGSFTDQLAGIYDGDIEAESLIDEGGIFRGVANSDVAKVIISLDKQTTHGTIFYDEHDRIMIVDKNLYTTPLLQTSIERNQQISFFDKLHTTGANLKLAPRMKAKLTFSMHTIVRDFEQACYRLRSLGKGQLISQLLVLEKDRDIIYSTLTNKYGVTVDKNDFIDVIVYFIIQQEERVSKLNWRAFKLALRSRLIERAATVLFDESKTPYRQSKHLVINPLEKIATLDDKLQPLWNAMDKNLFFSANFAPITDKNFAFFDQHAKVPTDILIAFDKIKLDYRVVILDHNDAAMWKDFLVRDRATDFSSRTMRYGVYDLESSRITVENGDHFDDQAIANAPRLAKLIAQAKFIAATPSWTNHERDALKEWLSSIPNKKALREIYRNKILAHRDKTFCDYEWSVVAKELGEN